MEIQKPKMPEVKEEEFEQRLIDLRRVTRVTEGGRQLRFRATLVIGNRKGKVGVGTAKGIDVSEAMNKAFRQAKKNIIEVPIVKNTIAHQVISKYHAAKVLIKPAKEGKGIVAGGAVKVILDLAGIPNVTAKQLGSSKNKINNARATIEALKKLKNI